MSVCVFRRHYLCLEVVDMLIWGAGFYLTSVGVMFDRHTLDSLRMFLIMVADII